MLYPQRLLRVYQKNGPAVSRHSPIGSYDTDGKYHTLLLGKSEGWLYILTTYMLSHFFHKTFYQSVQTRNPGIAMSSSVEPCTFLGSRFGSSSYSIWISYTSFERSWPADLDYFSFGSIP